LAGHLAQAAPAKGPGPGGDKREIVSHEGIGFLITRDDDPQSPSCSFVSFMVKLLVSRFRR
jgi:hypothetical protein